VSPTDDLQAQVDAIRWYHSMDLGDGIRTSGLYDPAARVDRYRLPDLHGKTVLDVGAWDGFWSFEAERRGAERVLATDSFSWSGKNWGSKSGFELARRLLGSSVEDRTIDVLDLSPDTVGRFDVVLFLGVLYHMRHPQLALDRVASVCDELLVLETHVDLVRLRRPAIALYRDRELSDDPTNFVGPNPAAVETMLTRAGFREIEVQPPAGYLYNAAKWAATRLLHRGHRMVFHARK
jgi:tRNA (mo5U34)-methyltransferase